MFIVFTTTALLYGTRRQTTTKLWIYDISIKRTERKAFWDRVPEEQVNVRQWRPHDPSACCSSRGHRICVGFTLSPFRADKTTQALEKCRHVSFYSAPNKERDKTHRQQIQLIMGFMRPLILETHGRTVPDRHRSVLKSSELTVQGASKSTKEPLKALLLQHHHTYPLLKIQSQNALCQSFLCVCTQWKHLWALQRLKQRHPNEQNTEVYFTKSTVLHWSIL